MAELVAALGAELPDGPTDPVDVVDHLAHATEPGLTAIPSGRFFGFVTSGTMANFTCLAAARDAVLTRAGWDVAARGLTGSPGVRVLALRGVRPVRRGDRDAAALRAAMSMHGAYLIRDEAGDPFEKVPEVSRRARAFTVWAVLRSLGRSGVAALVERLAVHARAFADGIAAIDGAEVLNDVVFTQVCARFGDDARTRDVVRRMLEDGTAWTTGSTWHGRAVLRISVSNWSTTDADVQRTLGALRAAVS